MNNFITTLDHNAIHILDTCPKLPVFATDDEKSAVIEWGIVWEFREWGIKSFNAVIYKVTLTWSADELIIENAEIDLNENQIPHQPKGLTWYAGKWEVEF